MIEHLFYKNENQTEKKAVMTALNEYILENKKVEIEGKDGDIIAESSSIEELASGISFELKEPIPDYIVQKRNMVSGIFFETLKKDKFGNACSVKFVKITA